MLTGFAVMILVAQIPPLFMERLAPVAYLSGVVLLIVVLAMGYGAKGAQRWLSLPGFRFQPSEILKLVMPSGSGRLAVPKTATAAVRDHCQRPAPDRCSRDPDRQAARPWYIDPDRCIRVFVLLLAGLQWQLLAGAAVLTVRCVWSMWNFVMLDYQKQRVMTFLNPESDPWGAGWNIIQSKIAIGSGGIEGKGWLMGTQSHLDFLPESHTDFIIAVLAEEFGLIGVIVLLLTYALIIGRGIFITLQAENLFAKLVAGSLTLTFFVYIFVNIGMVSGLLPVVGVPLPPGQSWWHLRDHPDGKSRRIDVRSYASQFSWPLKRAAHWQERISGAGCHYLQDCIKSSRSANAQ